jgi:hypothetical protein
MVSFHFPSGMWGRPWDRMEEQGCYFDHLNSSGAVALLGVVARSALLIVVVSSLKYMCVSHRGSGCLRGHGVKSILDLRRPSNSCSSELAMQRKKARMEKKATLQEIHKQNKNFRKKDRRGAADAPTVWKRLGWHRRMADHLMELRVGVEAVGAITAEG